MRCARDHRQLLVPENSLLFAIAKTEWKISSETISSWAPFMILDDDMSNDESRVVKRRTMVGIGLPGDARVYPTQHRKIESGNVSTETFTLPLEVARRKVRDILDRVPANGYREIVERWRQLADGNIQFSVRHLQSLD
jgi:hypothetical protein